MWVQVDATENVLVPTGNKTEPEAIVLGEQRVRSEPPRDSEGRSNRYADTGALL